MMRTCDELCEPDTWMAWLNKKRRIVETGNTAKNGVCHRHALCAKAIDGLQDIGSRSRHFVLMRMRVKLRTRTSRLCKWLCVSCMKGWMYFVASKGVFRISIIMLLASTFVYLPFALFSPGAECWSIRVTMLPLSMELRRTSYDKKDEWRRSQNASALLTYVNLITISCIYVDERCFFCSNTPKCHSESENNQQRFFHPTNATSSSIEWWSKSRIVFIYLKSFRVKSNEKFHSFGDDENVLNNGNDTSTKWIIILQAMDLFFDKIGPHIFNENIISHVIGIAWNSKFKIRFEYLWIFKCQRRKKRSRIEITFFWLNKSNEFG